MAEQVFKDGTLSIGGTDLSDRTVSATLNLGAETPDNTSMGNNTRTVVAGGLKTVGFSATLLQDFASSQTDATIWTAYNAGTATAIVLKPTSGAVSATNPSYSGNFIISEYTPIQGNVGDVSMVNITAVPTGDITRATA